MNRARILELFTLFNLAFLVLDVLLAHSVNAFAHWTEWIPVGMAAGGSLALAAAHAKDRLHPTGKAAGPTGVIVGWAAILTGVGGFLLHLNGDFFSHLTVASLVYTAPVAAPLAFTGLGFLLLMNRSVDPHTEEWGRWVLFFALGGFVGNFGLCLADHAQNGFFYRQEWISVAAAALAVGFLLVAVGAAPRRGFLRILFAVLALQAVVGGLGFYYHVAAILSAPGATLFTRAVFGAPMFAPLLFVDIAALGALGAAHLWAAAPAEGPAASGTLPGLQRS